MTPPISEWNTPTSESGRREIPDAPTSHSRTKQPAVVPGEQTRQNRLNVDIWFNDYLFEFETTSNLDSQHPATLYYLGQVIKINKIDSVYVEQREDGCRKHWAVLTERDYDIMDSIYDIEAETHDRFPLADLNFRVTINSERGPSVSKGAIKIYDKK